MISIIGKFKDTLNNNVQRPCDPAHYRTQDCLRMALINVLKNSRTQKNLGV